MHSPINQPLPPLKLGPLRRMLYRRAYAGEAASVPAAREHFCEAACASGLDPELVEAASLGLTELATNAVQHAGGRFMVVVSIRGRRRRYLRLEVHDRSKKPPLPVFLDRAVALYVLEEMDFEATSGRGLAMVASLADRTGVEQGCNGKSLWFELRLDQPGTDSALCVKEGAVASC